MGKRYLIDTNVVRKYLEEDLSEAGLTLLDTILDASESNISVISRIELLGFSSVNEDLLHFITQFIDYSTEYHFTEPIIQKTIELRKSVKVKLPDAIIAATALCNDFILMSNNDSDFGKIPNLRYINPRKLK
jgi:predicted nucleic acid-binding protein